MPIKAVARQRADRDRRDAHVSSAATSVVLRPMRSPKWPKSATDGRATNAIANVASEAAADADRTRERTAGEHEHRRGRVDVEIEELDRGADQAGEHGLPRAVDRFVGRDAMSAMATA
jgi:hypothetical protein